MSSALSKPVHPATVHWPLTFLSAAFGLDALNPIMPYLPTTLASRLPLGPQMSTMSYYALAAGILTSLPAIVSGGIQGYKAVQAQGLTDESGAVKSKFKTMIAHAVFNDVVTAGAAWVWWCKHQSSLQTYAPANWMVGVQVLLGMALLWAAHLGGSLTYNYGMGLNVGAAGKAKGKGKAQ